MKALALFSGGLDSTLAIKVVQEAGIEVEALNFTSPFCRCLGKQSGCGGTLRQSEKLGVKLHIQACGEEYLRLVEHPPHGYGRNLNPCLDCRIYKFRRAKEFMHEIGASFLVTGEVLNQRPNSQRMDAMAIIDREAEVRGLVLRPLSAALMEPTLPEIHGWVDRSRLLGIHGRTRKVQMAMAESFGISDYPCPSGGCLLTSMEFAQKVRDLMKHGISLSVAEVNRLKIGRHFRLSSRIKAIVGRDEAENKLLQELAKPGEILLEVAGFKGPLTLGSAGAAGEDMELMARLTARYSDAPAGEKVKVNWGEANAPSLQELAVITPQNEDLIPYLVVQTA